MATILADPFSRWREVVDPPTEMISRRPTPPLPILRQRELPPLEPWEDASEVDAADDREQDGDYENAEPSAWPRPAWGFVMLALAVACWVVSPRGFLARRLLSDFFLWAATACLILGLIILAGRWFVGDSPEDETESESESTASPRRTVTDVATQVFLTFASHTPSAIRDRHSTTGLPSTGIQRSFGTSTL